MAKTSAKETKDARPRVERVSDLLRLPSGPVDLAAMETSTTPGCDGSKSTGRKALALLGPRLADLQERFFAEGRSGGSRRLLLVLQGMDTSGKGGTLRHVVGQVDPQGVTIRSFKAPTREELTHDFLWRIKRALPEPGMFGVFDRSHYEDVLVARVHETVPEQEWRRRYDEINAFEANLASSGTTIVKCFLHISYATQRERLLSRLDDPSKRWKFNEGDIDERAFWSDYQAAFTGMLQHCSTADAPWYVVPSDLKWYRNWAIGEIMREILRELNPQYPAVELDLPRLRQRLQPPY